MMMDKSFWKNRKVLITGHTGFKGSWLCLILNKMGADVTGYALEPPTNPSLFELAHISDLMHSVTGDIRDYEKLSQTIQQVQPEIVVHMAAQPLVRESYLRPVETYQINVIGTANVLEAIRICPSVKAMVNVTTDKVYENKEWLWGYRENEPLGGYDPYSNSKACSELVTAAYRNSFFNAAEYNKHHMSVASVRAGNVIGGGDWASDRLIPDFIRAILKGEKIKIRCPHAIRPWQHVLEPLTGYLMLAEKLYTDGPQYAEAWNFGPAEEDSRTVEWIVKRLCSTWGNEAAYEIDTNPQPHETNYLKLDCSKSRALLGWEPKWSLEKTIDSIIVFTKAFRQNEDIRALCYKQIKEYFE